MVENGGRAGIANHPVTDFLKFGKLRATPHDLSVPTCISNNFGFEVAFARILATVASCDGVLFAISSSGRAINIRNAAVEMRKLGGEVVTLGGFKGDNPLRSVGDMNIWLDSSDYGMIQIRHQFVLHYLAERIRLQVPR